MKPSKEEIEAYTRLGYSGFILWYQKEHNGSEPSYALLNALANRYQNSAGAWLWNLFSGIVNALT